MWLLKCCTACKCIFSAQICVLREPWIPFSLHQQTLCAVDILQARSHTIQERKFNLELQLLGEMLYFQLRYRPRNCTLTNIPATTFKELHLHKEKRSNPTDANTKYDIRLRDQTFTTHPSRHINTFYHEKHHNSAFQSQTGKYPSYGPDNYMCKYDTARVEQVMRI